MGSPCLFTRQQALKMGIFTCGALKIRVKMYLNDSDGFVLSDNFAPGPYATTVMSFGTI